MPDPASKDTWAKVTLADCCEEIGQRLENPAESGYERFVGLEHLESGDISIRDWGSTKDVTSSMKLFKAGDVIVARRNVYLRRASRADFDGVCSGDGIVLRASYKACLPDLLPFLVNTAAFWDYVSSQADGPMSKRITVRRLMAYELDLLPLEEQRRIVEVLKAANRHTDSLLDCQGTLDQLLESALQREFPIGTERAPLSDWCRNLITYGIVQAGPNIPGGVPYIRVSDMTAGAALQLDGMLRTSPEIASKYKRSEVETGDIVVALRGPVGLPMVVPPELDGANLTQGPARVSVDTSHCADYVLWALKSPTVRRQYLRYAKGSTFSEISLGALRKVELPVRHRDEQAKIADRLNTISASRDAVTVRIASSLDLYRTCLDASLGGDK